MMIRVLMLAILAIFSSAVVAEVDTFGDWEVGDIDDKSAFYAAPKIIDANSKSPKTLFYFSRSRECLAVVTALIATDKEENIEPEVKNKKMLLTIDDDVSWGADKVLVSKQNNIIWVRINITKEDEAIMPALKKGNKLKLEIGSIPAVEYSLKGAGKALTTAEERCRASMN